MVNKNFGGVENRLSDNNVEVRRAAVSGLISNYTSAKNAVPALIKALRDSDRIVSANAAIALGYYTSYNNSDKSTHCFSWFFMVR